MTANMDSDNFEQGRSSQDIVEFVNKYKGDFLSVQIFVGSEFTRQNPDEDVFVWIRVNLQGPGGSPKRRPHREYMVAVFESDRYRDPLSKAHREAARTMKILARHGYESEIV